jgi:hypothetical protein
MSTQTAAIRSRSSRAATRLFTGTNTPRPLCAQSDRPDGPSPDERRRGKRSSADQRAGASLVANPIAWPMDGGRTKAVVPDPPPGMRFSPQLGPRGWKRHPGSCVGTAQLSPGAALGVDQSLGPLGVDVDGSVGRSMDGLIGLVISTDVHAAQRRRTLDLVYPGRGQYAVTACLHEPRRPQLSDSAMPLVGSDRVVMGSWDRPCPAGRPAGQH